MTDEERKGELAPVPEEERIRRVQELEKDLPPSEDERVAQQLEPEPEPEPGSEPVPEDDEA